MAQKRILALLGLLLGLVAGVLLLVNAFTVRGNETITLEFLAERAILVLLGLAILFGSLLLYRGKHSTGGIVNLLLGVVVLVLGYGTTPGILAVISGVLGLVAEQAAS